MNTTSAMRLVATSFVIFLSLLAQSVNANQYVVDVATPDGFVRTEAAKDSYSHYLRSLPLKKENTIQLWDGSVLPLTARQSIAVLALPLLFEENLEQCADFSMRLWAEYLKSINKLDSLALYDFYGNKKPYAESRKPFKDYLHWHMKYSNSYSIKLGAKKVRVLSELSPGDMFVQNDSEESIGHVSVVLDEAVNSFGHKMYLVGYSFMPAQEFRIEKASEEYGMSGWFSAQGYEQYARSVFGSFGEPWVMRF